MDKLTDNWITEGRIDFEYKKYLLLAYLKTVGSHFSSNELYPWLGDLVEHYRRVVQLIENKKKTEGGFPKKLEQIDLQNFMLRYETAAGDDELMREVERIVSFSAPALQTKLDEGRDIYEWIESQIEMEPVGIIPLVKLDGFLFIQNGEDRQVHIYRYALEETPLLNHTYKLSTQFVQTDTLSIMTTYEAIKARLLQTVRWQQPPAVYALESGYPVPLTQTLLPIARRLLLRRLVSGEAGK